MVASAFHVPEDHFLLRRVKPRRFVTNVSRQEVTEENIRHALRANRTNLLNANRSYTEEQYDHVPGLLSQHLIRHGRAGLGKTYKAFARKETRASEWQPTAYDSPCFSFLSWNAGNLERRVSGDIINLLLGQPFHGICCQEASQGSVQMPLYDVRGIASSVSTDRCMMINAGGGGFKMIRPVHDTSNHFCNFVQRPSRYGTNPPAWDAPGIEQLEMQVLAEREERGTALGHTMLRSLSNPELHGVRPLT